MDFSRLNRNRTIFTLVASAALLLSLLFLPWYSLSHLPDDIRQSQGAWICGTNDYSCTGFETFPILRWLLILAAFAPAILAWILIRGHKLSWPPGEVTMIAGFSATVLIAYNGIIDKPGSHDQEIGVSLAIGYWIALLGALGIGLEGFLRSMESGGRQKRKAPGTV